MAQSSLSALSRRERQIMEIIYCHGRATAGEIHRELPDRPSYSTVRTLLRVLEEKGYLDPRKRRPALRLFPVHFHGKGQTLRDRAVASHLLQQFGGQRDGRLAGHVVRQPLRNRTEAACPADPAGQEQGEKP